jgi:tetratricopeptide (TPR) repeat protein
MVRVFIIVFLLILNHGCSDIGKEQPKKEFANGENTDSIVVNNLINKSNESYYKNIKETSPFDSFLKEAEQIANKNSDEIQLASIYNIVGKRFRNKSLYKESIDFFNDALEIAEKLDRTDLLVVCYNQLGVVYRRIDQNHVAMDYHVEAMSLAESLNDSFNIQVALNGIGNINLNLKRYHAAIEYFRRSLTLSVNEDNFLGQAINNNNIGEAFLGLNEPDSALHYFFISLELNKNQVRSLIGESICYNSIGDAYIAKGSIGVALEYLKKALAINKNEGDKLHVSVSYNHLGETYMKAGDYQSAVDYLEKGLQIGEDIGSIFQMEEALRLLAQVLELQGHYKKALSLQRLSNIYKDSIINEKDIHYISTMETILETEKQKNEIMILSKEKASQGVKIDQQRVIIITIVLLALILAFSIALIVFQNRLRSRYKTLKYQQQLLRTQMNPHFIFNALSAIQVFILENDKEKASRFLSDFAKLMRQVLQSSNYDYISLRDEIEVVGYYLKLQQLRFEHPFNYEVEIDEQLDLDNVMVPPMLTQPFLENAIEHGFKHMQAEALLNVRFLKLEKSLIIEVDDNGLGIDKMIGYKKKNHDPMALKITEARLEILEKDAKGRTSFSIIDKKRLNPFDRGTLIRFVLPMIISKGN